MKTRLMGVLEAAWCLGVSRQRASQLSYRPDFPLPLAELAMGPVWLADDIEQYAADRDRRSGRPRKETE